jgi:nitrite reductase/ring-hydroxylating ferredoxin subunit
VPYVKIDLAVRDIVEGVPVCAITAGRRIAIFRLGDELFALSDFCTHEFAHLSDGVVDGETIVCPLHGARFSIRTGLSMSRIAPVDLHAYDVRERDGMVVIGI